VGPISVDFDLLEEFDPRKFRHRAVPRLNRPYNRP
jgi:hypothetical protein